MSIAERAVYDAKKAAVAAKKYMRYNRTDVYCWVFAAVMVLPVFLIMRTMPAKVPASIVGSAMSALAVAFEKNNVETMDQSTFAKRVLAFVLKCAYVCFRILKAIIDFIMAFTDMPTICGMVGFASSNITLVVPYLPPYAAFICSMIASAIFSAHMKKHGEIFIPAGNIKACVVLGVSSFLCLI